MTRKVEVLLHTVLLKYYTPDDTDDDTVALLIKEGKQRAKEGILMGCREGELYCYVHPVRDGEIIAEEGTGYRGWWSIVWN